MSTYLHRVMVNSADFTLWRNTLGSTVDKYSAADGNGDGVVGELDYTVWKTSYGQTYTPPQPQPPRL